MQSKRPAEVFHLIKRVKITQNLHIMTLLRFPVFLIWSKFSFAIIFLFVLKGFEVSARKRGQHKMRIWLKISSSGLKILDERTGVSQPSQVQQPRDTCSAFSPQFDQKFSQARKIKTKIKQTKQSIYVYFLSERDVIHHRSKTLEGLFTCVILKERISIFGPILISDISIAVMAHNLYLPILYNISLQFWHVWKKEPNQKQIE